MIKKEIFGKYYIGVRFGSLVPATLDIIGRYRLKVRRSIRFDIVIAYGKREDMDISWLSDGDIVVRSRKEP